MKKIIILLNLSIFCLFADPLDPKNFTAPNQQEIAQNKDISDLKNNEFYLNLDENEIKEVQDKDKSIREAFDGFSKKEINYKPMILPISSFDSIEMHPYFTTTLLLPQGSVVSHIDSSSPMAVLKYENNAILIRPNSDFQVANFTILYKLDEKNQILNILGNRYEKSNGAKLNLTYAYENIKKRDDLEVIHAYIKENGTYPTKEYSYIQLDGISYRIVQDNKYGTNFVNGKKYRVDNQTIYR
nr:hypothetical protein [Campylobacter sp.]